MLKKLTFLVLFLTSTVVHAIPIYEASLENATAEEAIAANEALLGVPVDFVGKLEDAPGFDTFDALPGLPGFPGTLSVTCTGTKLGELDECISFDWVFDDSSLASAWEIVKIGIKSGGGLNGYWRLDPFAKEGSFSCASYSQLFGGDGTSCLPDILAISNITFFGTPNTTTMPEPSTLALLGLGVLGIGCARKRRA